MTVCANRTDDPGFFTSCWAACGGSCVCGQQVAAETETSELEVGA
jgi:hypothetical protein